MKKFFLTAMIALMGISQMMGMSMSKIRTHARFLTDRMAYELDLTPRQYDDVYEINFDFIYMADRIMDDVVYGYRDALDRYYDYLDDRNDDIRYVLSASQYRRFLAHDYFFRPIYRYGSSWNFRIYTIYSNRTFFYFDAPLCYHTYKGAHCRHTIGHTHYYIDRYAHQHVDRYNDNFRIKGSANHATHQRNDFGTKVMDRNDKHQNAINNYKNSNQRNRTSDSRYQDQSGNTHSPNINSRGQGSSTSTSRTQSAAGSAGTTRNPSASGSASSTRTQSATGSAGTTRNGRR